ncbi:MAG: TRASH domain protein [Acidobacteria bacterium]|nr:TRASH domain protein [Acidobacteriota bacterium]
MLGWFLRLLLVFFVVRAVLLLLGGLMRGIVRAAQVPDDEGRQAPAGPGRVARSNGTLVQDPVCGTYVLQDRALSMRTPTGDAFFCSERCRSAYDAQAARAR